MIIVLPTCAKDEHLALLNLELARRLDKPVTNRCIIPVELGYDAAKVISAAKNFFAGVEVFQFPPWRSNQTWPRPQNWCWQSTARYMMQNHKEPWFWWEPDCVPLESGWIGTLEKAYAEGKKPFMGYWMPPRTDWKTPYMVGIGVYPPNVAAYCPECLMVEIPAWDMVLGRHIEHQCHATNSLIDHHIQAVSFPTRDEVDKIPESAILFHKCKDGSLPLLLLGRGDHAAHLFSKPLVDAPKIEVEQSPLTVVITNYKRPEHVWNAFQSCLNAGVQNIVVSASGTDDVLAAVHDKIRGVKSDAIIDAIPDDRGCNEMWLRGAMKVVTPWLQILHEDDVLLPSYRSIHAQLACQHPGFFHFAANRIGIAGTEANGTLRSLPNISSGMHSVDLLYPIFTLGGLTWSPVAGIFHADHVQKVLQECEEIKDQFELRPNMMIGNDLLLWLRALEKQFVFYWINEPMVGYGCWPGSCTFHDIESKENKLPPLYSKMREYFKAHPSMKPSNTEPRRPVFEAINGAHGIQPKLIHCVERHPHTSNEARIRTLTAIKSWEYLYNTGQMVPMHYSRYRRDSSEVGDDRKLPFWKDVIAYGLTAANTQDIIVFTNDDTILHPQVAVAVRRALQTTSAVSSHRCEYMLNQPPNLNPNAPLFRESSKTIGRDLFAFRVPWLVEHWHEIPDFIIGAPAWDIIMAMLIRHTQGATQINLGKYQQCWECELPIGFVGHIWHEPVWNQQSIQQTSKANAHNNLLARQVGTRLYWGKAWSDLWGL